MKHLGIALIGTWMFVVACLEYSRLLSFVDDALGARIAGTFFLGIPVVVLLWGLFSYYYSLKKEQDAKFKAKAKEIQL